MCIYVELLFFPVAQNKYKIDIIKEQMMKNTIKLLCAITLISSPFAALSADVNAQCNVADCNAGSKVVTFSKKDDYYYACQTRELSEYVNFVIGNLSMSAAFGVLPNISPITGDPEYQGESKQILDKLRSSAGVKTFDEGMSLCKKGKHGLKMLVANNPKDSLYIWVFSEKNKESFWMPKTFLNLRK